MWACPHARPNISKPLFPDLSGEERNKYLLHHRRWEQLNEIVHRSEGTGGWNYLPKSQGVDGQAELELRRVCSPAVLQAATSHDPGMLTAGACKSPVPPVGCLG